MRFKLQSENQYSTPADPGISQAAGGVGVFRFFAWCVCIVQGTLVKPW